MYEAFFGLREKPFNLTPDPRFLFLSEKHKEAFAHLLYGIKNRGGFVMVTGEIGTGKTTICRTLLGKLEDDTEVAFIFNPCMSPEELLRTINEDFGIHSRAGSVKGLIDELNAYLLDRKTRGKNCVLVIDEAQNLTPQVLEQIRLLSNLETEQEKLLQIVLIGQPELAEHLELHELRQLDQRITARYHLRELDREETLQYIAYRLRVAGGRGKIRFTRSAVRAVYRYSGGVPRMINAISDRALLVAYTQESRDVTSAIVRRAAKEVRGERFGKKARKPAWGRVLKPVAAAAVLGALLAGGYWSAPFLAEQWTALKGVQASRIDPGPGPISTGKTNPDIPATPAALLTAPPASDTTPPAAPAPAADETVSEDILEGLDPVLAREAAAATVLAMWDVTPKEPLAGDDLNSLFRYITSYGLNAENVSPTLEQLLAIDLPAFATILGKDYQPMWVGIVGRQGDDITIATAPGQTAQVSQEAFEKRYTIQAVVPWRDDQPSAGLLQETMDGEDVAGLQARLATLGRLKGSPSGVYDAATVTAIRLVQHETGLMVDGKVGRQTRMVLSSWDDTVNAPSLKVGPPAPPEAAPETVVAAVEPDAAPEAETTVAAAEPAAPPAPAPEIVSAETPAPAEPPAMVDVARAPEAPNEATPKPPAETTVQAAAPQPPVTESAPSAPVDAPITPPEPVLVADAPAADDAKVLKIDGLEFLDLMPLTRTGNTGLVAQGAPAGGESTVDLDQAEPGTAPTVPDRPE